MISVLTERMMKETVDPVSDCSPIDFRRREGSLERILMTGMPFVSWRSSAIDDVRKCIKHDNRSGRKGR